MKPKPPGRPWVKGQSGNPAGKPKQLLTVDNVSALFGRFATMTREKLQAVAQNPDSTMIEIMVASIMAKAAKDGDYSRMAFLLDRTIGKVKDVAEVHQRIEGSLEAIDAHPEKNVLALLRQMHGPKASGE